MNRLCVYKAHQKSKSKFPYPTHVTPKPTSTLSNHVFRMRIENQRMGQLPTKHLCFTELVTVFICKDEKNNWNQHPSYSSWATKRRVSFLKWTFIVFLLQLTCQDAHLERVFVVSTKLTWRSCSNTWPSRWLTCFYQGEKLFLMHSHVLNII